ncbi:CD177 antigen-like [Trichosurus vulpecula]|uniref:CD177 antigen-like n=1 Tax=Trichosurus vulpecula TaxID=9337 RepID=UPI00186B3FDD|nr:CD177 antigen-like [Trichosurus vulpecula]
MACVSFPLLLGLVGASLAQTEDRPFTPIFPLLPPVACYHTEMLYLGRKLNSEPELWTSSLQHSKRCEKWEVCQETLLMLETVTGKTDYALRCPVCLALYSCPTKVHLHRCSEKALRCYNGTIQIKGEGVSYDLGLLGCSTVPNCELFLGMETIGPFTLSEKCLDHHRVFWPRSQGAPRPAWAWTLGLGLLLTL